MEKISKYKGTVNMKRKRGASLMYVLIVMTIITICTINFLYFIQERKEILKLREGYTKNG